MFQEPFENDYSIADTDHKPFHWRKASAPEPWSYQISVLWAEEEQECEDPETTREVEAEKQKGKKHGARDDKSQPPRRPKEPKPRKK